MRRNSDSAGASQLRISGCTSLYHLANTLAHTMSQVAWRLLVSKSFTQTTTMDLCLKASCSTCSCDHFFQIAWFLRLPPIHDISSVVGTACVVCLVHATGDGKVQCHLPVLAAAEAHSRRSREQLGCHAAAGRAVPGLAPAYKETAPVALATPHGLHHCQPANLCSGQLGHVFHAGCTICRPSGLWKQAMHTPHPCCPTTVFATLNQLFCN